MKKRIISIFMVIALIISLVPMYVLAATPTPIIVTTDKASAYEGETITYSIKIGAVEHMQGFEFKVSIPTGLTYVSATVATGLKETLGSDKADWTESSKKFIVAGGGDYSSSSETAIMELKCTVDVGATGTIGITLIDIDMSDPSYGTIETELDVSNAKTSVTAAPVAVTGVQIDESVVLDVGESKQVNWAVNPTTATNQNVELTIDDTSIATVSETGLVKGVAVGEATITITTEDGGYTDTCKVTVNCPHTNKTNVGAKPSTCIEKGWEAYSKCNDCEQLFDSEGNEINDIPYLPLSTTHTEGKEWKYNDTQHWHECTVVGCGTVIETSRANHSGGTATCQNKAVCATCNQPYGAFADHNYGELIAQVNPVHTPEGLTDGTAAHYKCSVCNELFNESKDEVTAADLVIPAAHTFGTEWEYDETQHWHECTCGAKEDIAAHSFQWVVDTPATEETTGVQHEECECGKRGSEGTVIPKLDHTHNWIETPAKPSTCVENGNNQYFYCTKCEKYFKSNKTTETTVEAETLPLADHTPSATWSYDGTYHWKVCTVAGCGTVINETKAEHIPDHPYATTEYPVKCTECGYEIEAQLAAVTHIAATITAPVLGATPDYNPTYVSTPSGGVQFGAVTWYKIKKEDYTGTDEDIWTDMASDETFTTEYYYSADMYFQPEDGYGISEDVTGTVNSKAHVDTYGSVYGEDPNGGDYAYLCIEFGPLHDADTEHFESDADNHWNNCSDCDEKQNVAPHDFEWVVDKEATETEKGSKHEECTVCGYKKDAVEIPATGTPKTGDSSNMLLWAALLLAGGLGTFGTVAYNKKRKEDAE